MAAVVFVLYGAYVAGRLAIHEWDASHFVTAGDTAVDQSRTLSAINVAEGSQGYDGQYYYRLALDPFPSEPSRFGVTLDRPAYRSQRVLYPLTARLLAFARPELIPWTLILVNLASIAAVGYLGALRAREAGFHSGFGLLAGLYPGFLLSLSRDLTEPLALALVLGSLLLLRRSKPWAAALVMAAAVLTREPVLLVAAVAAAVWLASKAFPTRRAGRAQVPWQYFTIPALVFAAWQLFLWGKWGQIAFLGGSGTPRNLPFTGIWEGFRLASTRGEGLPLLWMLEVAFLVGLWLAAGLTLRGSQATPVEKWSFLGFVALSLVLSGPLWEEDWGFLRIGSDAAVLGGMVLLASPSRRKAAALVPTVLLWAALAVLNAPI